MVSEPLFLVSSALKSLVAGDLVRTARLPLELFMTITWLGQNCFKIEGKNGTVIIDPVDPKAGKMPKVGADLLVLPKPLPEKDRAFLKEPGFVIDTPGEFEVKGIFVRTAPDGEKGELVTRLEIDGLRLGHLGWAKQTSDAVNAFLENVDILFVPTGGGDVLGPAEAAKVVTDVEPRVVIPMHFKTPDASHLQSVEKFCQAVGMKAPEAQAKVSLSPKDLPSEETKLIVLE